MSEIKIKCEKCKQFKSKSEMFELNLYKWEERGEGDFVEGIDICKDICKECLNQGRIFQEKMKSKEKPEQEESLSDKIIELGPSDDDKNYYWEGDVKKFIRKLKEGLCQESDEIICEGCQESFYKSIDKLAGEKLVE